MKEELKQKLRVLAQKYEVASFTEKDPSQFLARYSDIKNTEVAAFIASLLAFGNRKQFIPKMNTENGEVDSQTIFSYNLISYSIKSILYKYFFNFFKTILTSKDEQ